MENIEYITDSKGTKRKVIIPLKEYETLLEKLEDLTDAAECNKILSAPETKYHTLEEFLKHINL